MKTITEDSYKSKNSVSAPQISLPKGGGAIKGIGEKFSSNPVTGTGSMSIPIPVTSGRSGFNPQLSLNYDSGSGNGPFGFGWNLSLPSITRKTDKGLPKYQDEIESDIFILSGAEDLVPVLLKQSDGTWKKDLNITVISNDYNVQLYRPRIEGLFARIERWTDKKTGDVHWRSISKDNITTIYGKTKDSRIYGHNDDSHIFSWLISESYDDKGNAIFYKYKTEDSSNIDISQVHEKNRNNQIRAVNLYLKSIHYGNLTPRQTDEDLSKRIDWLFEVVFDYGEHDPNTPTTSEVEKWAVRDDPFSLYRAGFEVRTYRLCKRVLMFHHFPKELGINDYLVSSMEFNYQESIIASFITKITKSSYVLKDDGTYLKKLLPALEFDYSQAEIQKEIGKIDSESLQNLPVGLDGHQYQWVDIDGEGISSILTEQADAWYYKPNCGEGKFGPLQLLLDKPSLGDLNSGKIQFIDLNGDGQQDLIEFNGPVAGFYERTPDRHWDQFKPFNSLPNVDWNDPNLKFTDLNGDGHADILISEDNIIVWYPSLAEAGFDVEENIYQPLDEENAPRIIFADGTQSIYLADLSGDGLSDIARIRNGEICYWPNLGYGHFGAKVTMDNSPVFESPDLFDQKRIKLADIDGSGTTDIIYLASDGIHIYLNQSGNSWSQEETLINLHHIDNITSVMVADLFGNGTACLLWSSPLSQDQGQQILYIDLMGGQKPHLLISTRNNRGAETTVQYSTSTKFYLKDRREGKPWITRIPFPVHVVERVETHDLISQNIFITRYAYHHGYFDGVEREFRGFGMVEQWDTEEIGVLSETGVLNPTNVDDVYNVPPVHTKTWYHTGAFLEGEIITQQFLHEYYGAPLTNETDYDIKFKEFAAAQLSDTILPDDLSADEEREACRALKGSILRQEVYADDKTSESGYPYSVSERNYTVELLQLQDINRYGVFFTHPRETIDYHYERNISDPRITHQMVLSVDSFGNVERSVNIAYLRLAVQDRLDKQAETNITLTANRFANEPDENDWYRIGLPIEARTYEVVKPPEPSVTSTKIELFQFNDIKKLIEGSAPGDADQIEGLFPLTAADLDNSKLVDYNDWNWRNSTPTVTETKLRLIEHVRTLYRKDDLTGSLDLGTFESLALPFETYKLAFTPELLENIFKRDNNALINDYDSLMLEGGYVPNEGDSNWWIPSGQVFYSPTHNDSSDNDDASSEDELSFAQQHFFIPYRYKDPFNNETVITYDNYDLLLLESEDPLHNKIIAGELDTEGNIVNKNDYRVMQPSLITDPNENQTEVAFDALGMVVGTAVMGKKGENKGDSLTGFNPDLTQQKIDDFYDDPKGKASYLLGNATTRIIYDINCFKNQGNPDQPTFAATIARETHVSDLKPGESSLLRIDFSYSDGFGREIQKKIQAEPGPISEGGDAADTCWVGSGWTIFNNKGKPIRKYEPFFSSTHHFEFASKVGVSPILFYDPPERVVTTLHPNHTYEKVIFDPWQQETWDVNDTIYNKVFDPENDLNSDGTFNMNFDPSSFSPADDQDVENYFDHLDSGEYLPTWYNLRADPNEAIREWPDKDQNGNSLPENAKIRDAEKSAAIKAAKHSATPTIAYLDSLGRTFLTVADNGIFQEDGKFTRHLYKTRLELDIDGNQREVIDAQNRKVMLYDYDMLKNKIHQSSMEAGERWTLNNAVGNSIRSWDSRGHVFRTEYDALHRPLRHYVQGADPQNPDNEILFEKTEYGEGEDGSGQSNVDVNGLNLRTKVYRQYDSAGMVTNEEYDFKGNLLSTSRKLVKDYKSPPNWPVTSGGGNVELDSDEYNGNTTFDALNRPVTMTMPDKSVIYITHNEANLLEKIDVNIRGGDTSTPFVANIDYDAKGQRELIEYGNGVKTTYEYDDKTFRLTRLTTKSTNLLQDLFYYYDPAGNITSIRDEAQTTVVYNQENVEPVAEYVYDAIYRLIEAHGREHIGQASQPHTWNSDLSESVVDPNNVQAVRSYYELYQYDEVGNFIKMDHKVCNQKNPIDSWIRTYIYDEESLIEPGRQNGKAITPNNRLSYTQVSNVTENYGYVGNDGLHGNMTSMPHLQEMKWDFKDQLQMVTKSEDSKVYYVYDAAGQRVLKVEENGTLTKERIYLGGFEIYREYNSNDTDPALERETLHIMDDKQRITLVETKTKETKPKNTDITELLVPVIRYQLNNHLGSASLELDKDAKIISYEEYYPYGCTSYQAVNSNIKAAAKRYRYTGKERDEETGLYYHGARYYIAWLGRWTNCDPIGIRADSNLYIYILMETRS